MSAAFEDVRFVSDPEIQDGGVCIEGTRIPPEAIQGFARAGYSAQSIQLEYPSLTLDQIHAAILYQPCA